ncbi:MAG: hypothetical protein QOG20_2328 [Pseudonocardiales bacterium]|nr:hypothetical protein [Pseudonocardiales bacterium]
MTEPLLHLATPAEWRAHLAVGAIVPSVAEFVHLSTPAQVALPAGRLFAGRTDLLLLVLDPDRIGVPVKWEPGLPTDPADMRFPHAYGPVPTSAVVAVLPYRPRTDGGFDAPAIPPLDDAARTSEFSLLRRVATTEEPVRGGVAVLTAPVSRSHQHNQLLLDGHTDVAALVADADRVLGGAGLPHRRALLSGEHLAPVASALAGLGWEVEELIGMAAPPPAVGPASSGAAGRIDIETARPFWDAMWRRELRGVDDVTVAQLTDRHLLEDEVVDLRCLAVCEEGEVVAACLLKVDGATAVVDAVDTAPGHQRRGHGNALLAEAFAQAGAAGCDLVTLQADVADWPRDWYARRGFRAVARGWVVSRA